MDITRCVDGDECAMGSLCQRNEQNGRIFSNFRQENCCTPETNYHYFIKRKTETKIEAEAETGEKKHGKT